MNIKNILQKFTFIADMLLVFAIIALFGLSIFTVVNLTPGYEAPEGLPEILGVKDNVYTGKGLNITNISEDDKLIQDLQINRENEQSYIVDVEIKPHNESNSYLPLIRILNRDSKGKTISFKTFTDFPDSSKASLVINQNQYDLDDLDVNPIPDLKIDPNKSIDMGVFIDSEEDINYPSSIRLTVNEVK